MACDFAQYRLNNASSLKKYQPYVPIEKKTVNEYRLKILRKRGSSCADAFYRNIQIISGRSNGI